MRNTAKKIVGYIDYKENIRISDKSFDINKYQKPFCEHCNANHNLRYTCIVRYENGDLKQIGYDCLKKVLGIEPAPKEIYSNEYTFNLYYAGLTAKPNNLKPLDVLTVILYQKDLTKADFIYLYTHLKIDQIKSNNFQKCKEQATTILQFYKTFKPYNEFTQNLKNLAISDHLDLKYFNLFKYAPKIYETAKNYIPAYNSKKSSCENIIIEKIYSRDKTEYDHYTWYKYILIDQHGTAFEIGTSKGQFFTEKQQVSFKRTPEKDYTSRLFGYVNKIKNLKLVENY